MTTPLDRLGRDGLLARIAELEAENARLAKEHVVMLENLTSVQARCTELLDANRAWRARFAASWCGHEGAPSDGFLLGLEAITGAAWRAELKHGTFHPRLTNIYDVSGDDCRLLGQASADGTSGLRNRVQAACSSAEKTGTVTWVLLALEELLEAIVEAERGRPNELRGEVAQLGAVCAAWIQAIDLRGAK